VKLNPWGSLRGLPPEVWALFSATLINRCGTMVLPFLVLYLTRDQGQPPRRAALALATYGLGSMLTSPIAGRLADRIGPRRIVIASLFSGAVLLPLLPLLHSIGAILALTFLWSVSAEALRPASLAWMSGLVPPERRRAGFALNRLAVNLGMSLGPAVAGFVVRYSFPAIFVLDALTSVAAGTLLLLATHGRGSGATEEEMRAPARPAATEARPAGAPRHAWLDRRFLWFLASILPVQIVFFQHESSLALYLVRDLHLAESTYGLLFTINTAMIIFIEVPLNAAMSEWPHRRCLMLGAFLIAAGFGGVGLARDALGIVLTVIVWTFGEMVLLPACAAFVAEAAPPAKRGEYLGLYSMSFSCAFAVAPFLGAKVMEGLGSRAVWPAALASGLLSVALLSRVAPHARPGDPQAEAGGLAAPPV
jgi:predicted MFS family arabinose efflux permease